MSARARLIFHAIALFHHLLTLLAVARMDFTNVTNPKLINIRDFSDRYFTGWNFAFQMIFLTLAVICDMEQIQPDLAQKFWHSDKFKRVSEVKDFIFTTLVFPFSVIVCVLFWSVYHYDRELVLPRVCDGVVTPFINHAMHTTIVPVVLMELLMTTRNHKTSHKTRILCIASVIMIYTAVVFGTYVWTGRWIYDLFAILTMTQKLIFLLMISVSVYTLYFLGCHADEVLIHLKNNPDSIPVKNEYIRQILQGQEVLKNTFLSSEFQPKKID